MREELFRTVYVATPVKHRDMYNHVTIHGYEDLRTYKTLVVEGAVQGQIHQFGYTPEGDLEVAFKGKKRENIACEDGLWIDAEPVADEEGRYQNPPYAVKSSRSLNDRRVYSAKAVF